MIPINNKPTINEIFLFILIYGFFFLQIKEYIFTENFYISAITICVYLFIILVIEILIIATIFKINFFQKFVLSKKIIFFLFIFINYYCVILSNSFDFTMIHYKSKLIEITKHASIGVIVTYIFFLNIDTVKRVSVLFIIINTLYIFNIDSLFSQKNENILRDSIGQKYLFKKKA